MSSSSSSTLRVALLCVFVVPKILLFPSLHFWKKKTNAGHEEGEPVRFAEEDVLAWLSIIIIIMYGTNEDA